MNDPQTVLRTLSAFDRWLLVSLLRTEGQQVVLSEYEFSILKPDKFVGFVRLHGYELVLLNEAHIGFREKRYEFTLTALGQQVAEASVQEPAT